MTGKPSTYARDYARLWSPVIRGMALAVLRHVPLGEARWVLDIGTGCGALVPALRAKAPGARIVGIDRSEEMARSAAQTGIHVSVMDAEHLGLRKGRFDAALAAFVLFFMPNPLAAMGEVRRTLRPGGLLATVTWGEDRFARAEQVWERELEAAGAPPRPEHPSADQVNGPEKMEQLCLGAGLKPNRVWREEFEHGWTPEALLELKTAAGLADRYRQLPESARKRVVRLARERFAALDQAAFVWRPEVVYCVASRP